MALKKPSGSSVLFDLKHIVMLRSGRQAERKVVYTRNPELVTYVEGDFVRKLAEWNPDFSKTYEGYWLRNHELIPWTAGELAGWRKMRDPGARDKE